MSTMIDAPDLLPFLVSAADGLKEAVKTDLTRLGLTPYFCEEENCAAVECHLDHWFAIAPDTLDQPGIARAVAEELRGLAWAIEQTENQPTNPTEVTQCQPG